MHSFKIRFRIYDLLFYLLLVFSFYYTRNMLCRLMMVVFFGYTVLQMITGKSKVPVPFFYVSFLAFVLYGAWNIMRGDVINAQVARTMVVSLGLNFIMIFSIVQYIYMVNDVTRVLRVAELGMFSTAFVVVLLSVNTITQGRLGGGTEINSNMLAILCVYGFTLTMYLRKLDRISAYSGWFRMVFYILVILLTGSRKGLIMVALATVVVQLAGDRKHILEKLIIGAGVVAVVYALIMNVEFLYNIVGVRVENLLTMLSEDGNTTEESLEERQYLVETGLRYIKQKPWTGYGYDCFKLVSGKGPNGKVPIGQVGFYSHNNYIELLFGGGIIGLALYYCGVLYLLIKLLRNIRKDICVPYLLAIIVAKMSIEYYYVSSYERIDAYILAIVLGCGIVAIKNREPSEVGEIRKGNEEIL